MNYDEGVKLFSEHGIFKTKGAIHALKSQNDHYLELPNKDFFVYLP